MVDMAPVSSSPQPTPMDLAPGPVMQAADASPPEAARQEAVEEQIAPTPPQEKPDVVAPPEQKQATPPKPEPAKFVPDRKPDTGKTQGDAARGEEAGRCAAGAAHHCGPARRAPGTGGIRRQRRRVGGSGGVLQADGRRASAALQAISAGRARPPASKAPRASVSRSAAAGRCCRRVSADHQAIPRSMPRRWRWSAAPSRFRRFLRT